MQLILTYFTQYTVLRVTMVTALFLSLSHTQSGLDTIPGQRGYLVVSADGSVLQVSHYVHVHWCFIVRGEGEETSTNYMLLVYT